MPKIPKTRKVSNPQQTAAQAQRELRQMADPQSAHFAARFFKTGPGEYGEGDVFLGLSVPKTRSLAPKYKDLPLSEISKLIKSKYHEERFFALVLLVQKSKKAESDEMKTLFDFYLKHMPYINNWDLIDTSAEHIVGKYLWDKDRRRLVRMAKSRDLWEKRIAIISTFHFIRRNEHEDTVRIARILLNDSHDLIHKAVGWMLREAGKRDLSVLRQFLNRHAHEMPRTMLRYAIEKLSPAERKKYMTQTKIRA